MENEARINELRAMIPYLVAEYNAEALGKIREELDSLGAYSQDVRQTAVNVALAWIKSLDGGSRYREQIGACSEQLEASITRGEEAFEEANKNLEDVIKRFRDECPVSVSALYFDYASLQPEGKDLISVFSREELAALAEKKIDMGEVIRRAAEKISIPNKDYDMAFNVYIALKDYPAARALRYRQGTEAMASGKYAEAQEFFRAALDHPGAKEKVAEIDRIVAAEARFKEKVGAPKTYLPKQLEKTHGTTLRQMRAELNKAYIDALDISRGGIFFCLIGFLLTLAMHTDPELDNNALYIFFPLAMSIAVHVFFDMDFGWIKSCAITFGILILPKILADFSVEWFETSHPAFFLLNVICAVPLVVALINALRKIPSDRAYRRVVALRAQLKPAEEKLRAELIAEFSPMVGKELAEKWVKDLRSGI